MIKDRAPLGFKTCEECNEVKKLDEFNYKGQVRVNSNEGLGTRTVNLRNPRCKECVNKPKKVK